VISLSNGFMCHCKQHGQRKNPQQGSFSMFQLSVFSACPGNQNRPKKLVLTVTTSQSIAAVQQNKVWTAERYFGLSQRLQRTPI